MSKADQQQLKPRETSRGNTAIAFALGFVLGPCIPLLRWALLGSSDPFQEGWPLFLHATTFLMAFVGSWRWHRGVASAVGIYVGLVAYVLWLGKSEYPAASMIALAIHGFLPALAGALVASAVRCRFGCCLPKTQSNV